jgi:hypothetical protein
MCRRANGSLLGREFVEGSLAYRRESRCSWRYRCWALQIGLPEISGTGEGQRGYSRLGWALVDRVVPETCGGHRFCIAGAKVERGEVRGLEKTGRAEREMCAMARWGERTARTIMEATFGRVVGNGAEVRPAVIFAVMNPERIRWLGLRSWDPWVNAPDLERPNFRNTKFLCFLSGWRACPP